MRREFVTILSESGMHARPAAAISAAARKYRSEIWIQKKGCDKWIDAKEMFQVLMMKLVYGDEIDIRAEGPDEAEAIMCLAELFQSRQN